MSIGLAAAATCAVHSNRLNAEQQQEIERLLESFGLPVRLPEPVDEKRLLSAMRFDKKVQQGRIPLILPSGLGSAELVVDVPAKLRATRTDGNRLLLKTEMEAGHGGVSGRDKRYEQIAFDYAFLLDLAGVAE